jgi:transposase-like protein
MHSFTREFKLQVVRAVRERGLTMAQASRRLGLSPDLCLGPPIRSFEHRNDLRMFQNRAAHNGADQPRQALRAQG